MAKPACIAAAAAVGGVSALTLDDRLGLRLDDRFGLGLDDLGLRLGADGLQDGERALGLSGVAGHIGRHRFDRVLAIREVGGQGQLLWRA